MVGLIRGLGNEAAESSHIRRRDGNVEFFEKIALQCIDLSTGLHECGGAALSDHQHAIVRINYQPRRKCGCPSVPPCVALATAESESARTSSKGHVTQWRSERHATMWAWPVRRVTHRVGTFEQADVAQMLESVGQQTR